MHSLAIQEGNAYPKGSLLTTVRMWWPLYAIERMHSLCTCSCNNSRVTQVAQEVTAVRALWEFLEDRNKAS